MSRIKRWVVNLLQKIYPTPITFITRPKPNQVYKSFARTGEITIGRQEILSPDDTFFTMGSCFAEEIRSAMTRRNLVCGPDYREIDFDPAEVRVDDLPETNHMNFYNTFTVRNQIEQALGIWTQDQDDYWKVRRSNAPWGDESYQDPYRRLILANSPEALTRTISKVNASVRHGIDAASAFIFTFGMTEVFINKYSGKAAAQKPMYRGGGGASETTMHLSTFAENLENILSIIDLVRSEKPNAPIIMSVSPVPLALTFQKTDVVTASTESKAILRAAIGQASRERDHVIYLPSYEFVTAKGLVNGYRTDKRHVRREVVDEIVAQFFSAYFARQPDD